MREREYQSARAVIQNCAADMQKLVEDPTVKAILKLSDVDLNGKYG
jgi:hypothetical protein